MVEERAVRDAASGQPPDADIISAWQEDFKQRHRSGELADKITLTLPTGKQIKAVRLPLILLLQTHTIPDKLTTLVSEFVTTIEQSSGDPGHVERDLKRRFDDDATEAMKSWLDLLNFVFVTCVVTPTFVLDLDEAKPAAGVFWVGSVNFYDKLYLFNWAQGVDHAVQEFLHKQIDALGTVSDEQGFRPTPEQLLASGEPGNFLAGVADRPLNVDMGAVRPRQDRRNRRRARAEGQETADADRAAVQVEADHGDADRAAQLVSVGSVDPR